MSTPNPARLTWRKSSFTNSDECVELAWSAVRDSKNTPGPMLTLDPTGLSAFIASAKAGTINKTVGPHR